MHESRGARRKKAAASVKKGKQNSVHFGGVVTDLFLFFLQRLFFYSDEGKSQLAPSRGMSDS